MLDLKKKYGNINYASMNDIHTMPGKNSKNVGNQNFGANFFVVFSFDFNPAFAFLRRFLGPGVGNQLQGSRFFFQV